jgi:hypothetical protein
MTPVINQQGITIPLVVPEAVLQSRPVEASEPLTFRFFLRGLEFFPRRSEILKIEGFDFEFALLDDIVRTRERLKDTNWGAVTASLTVRQTKASQFSALDDLVERLTWLLTFAGGGPVGVPRIEIEDANQATIKTILRALLKTRHPFRPPILLDHPGVAVHWLQSSYDRFAKLENKYRLRGVIHMLALADSENIVTLSGLIVANTLEILRFNFAHNILVPSGHATKKGDNFFNSKTGKPMSFLNILDSLVKELGITKWDRKAVRDFRNKIIHEGVILGSSVSNQNDTTLGALHFCHIVVLSLLNWDKAGGRYVPVDDPDLKPIPFVR